MIDRALNPRLASVPPSATIGLMDRAREMAAAGADIVSLAGGEPDVPPAQRVRAAAVERIRSGELSYGPVAGLAPLRDGIAAKLSHQHGHSYDAGQVIVGTGAKQLLFEALFAASAPGDHVLIPAPYWVSYPAMAALCGTTPVILPTSEAEGHKLGAATLAAALRPESRWLILNSPANPTGAVYSADELAALAEVIERHPRLLVLADDIYEDIVYDGVRHHSLVRVAPHLAERVVTCSGFSKGHAMTGFRVGYAAGPQWLVSAMVRLQSHLTSGGCVVGQAAAVTALLESEEFPRERLDVYAQRRARMVELVSETPLLRLRPPEGAFYGWIGLQELLGGRSGGGTSIDSDVDFAEALLVENGLAAVPGSAFGAPGYLRLSFATAEDLLEQGLHRLVSFARSCAPTAAVRG